MIPKVSKDGFRYYGKWAGNPKGCKEDTDKCIAEVWESNIWFAHQCERKRGHGIDGLFCKQHAKKYSDYESE